ncbi:MAG: response regulator transcription factor [Alphaproteobacteria bacterium]|nr:response regulator transcription factor [Alphaproteobacteria bacterium]
MPRILFVEDEAEVLKTLTKFFTREGYEVHGARTGAEAIDIADSRPVDIAVLDVMLQEGPAGSEGMDGFEICRSLRDGGFDRPIIFVTARTTEQDKLLGFEMGADDYVTKPFSLLELKARIEANLRRAGGAKSVYKFGDVEVDLDAYEIRHADGAERLSNRERDLLRYFIEHAGKIIPRDELLKRVWEYKSGIATRTVDTHVLTVRKKLRDDASSPRFIQTLHGVGYQFIAKEGA